MSELAICKAQPTGKEKVEPLTVIVAETLPAFEKLAEQDLFTSTEANRLEQALYNTLPGATYDRLFAAMCLRKASHLRVTG
jgi:hypothetical protein